jgi:hypothetical protein
MPEPAAAEQHLWDDLGPLLDLELSRLPEKYRAAIVLCDLEGKTRKEAARQLGVPEGTLAARLARGRALLAKRLARHGLAVSGGPLAAVLAQNAASAPAPASLVFSTIKAANLFAAGEGAAAGAISAKVAVLTEGVLKAMLLTRLKIATAVVLVACLLGGAWGLYRAAAVGPPEPKHKGAKQPKGDGDSGAKLNLPRSRALEQVLVRLTKDGKLVVKVPIGRFYAYAPDEVRVLDARGKAMKAAGWAKLIKGEMVAMAADHGLKVDPLHLRVLKGDILVFLLPPPDPRAVFTLGGTDKTPLGVPAPAEEKPLLPKGRPPEQVLVSLGKEGKLKVTSAVTGFVMVSRAYPGGESFSTELITTVRSQTVDLDDLRVVDTKGARIDRKTLAKLIKGETVAVALFDGQDIDPLHLRVLKEGTLVFLLPAPKPAQLVRGQGGCRDFFCPGCALSGQTSH